MKKKTRMIRVKKKEKEERIHDVKKDTVDVAKS